MRMLDLFSGIGGFAYAAQQVWGDDLDIVAFCEIDPYCCKVLNKHWPETPIMGDIKDVTKETLADTNIGRLEGASSKESRANNVIRNSGERSEENRIDLLTGGFPCQPASIAGKRKGKADDRWLWPEMFRVIRELKPAWVIAENVRGLLTLESGMVFEHCCADLEGEGYEVQPFNIPACAVDAPHRRERIWIVAYSDGSRQYSTEKGKAGNDTRGSGSDVADTASQRWRPEGSTSKAISQSKTEQRFAGCSSGKEEDAFCHAERGGRSGEPRGRPGTQFKDGCRWGQLNPTWVEWLMGFPGGWTDLNHSETP